MPEDKAQLILTELRGFRELVEEKFNQNEDAHSQVNDHLTKLNGQVIKNNESRIRQGTHNKWMYGLVISIAIPTTFLFLRSVL